jgi:hypothetical protein
VFGSHRWANRFKAISPDHIEFLVNPDHHDMPDIDANRSDYRLAI